MSSSSPPRKRVRLEDDAQDVQPTKATSCLSSQTAVEEAWPSGSETERGDSPIGQEPGVFAPQTARWCQIREDGMVEWDASKVTCFIPNDQTTLRSLVRGVTVSARMHPLIFDTPSSEGYHEMSQLRSIAYFSSLIRNAQLHDGASPIYQNLDETQKDIVAFGVRDLFLASWRGFLNGDEEEILREMVDLLDPPTKCPQVEGMSISFYPSANHKIIKFVEDPSMHVGNKWANHYVQVRLENPDLYAVFVDPAELSYHNFENIIPLDRWFESQLGKCNRETTATEAAMDLRFEDLERLQPEKEIWSCKLHGATSDLLKRVSALDLYVAPLNKETRGGRRFIFHSALLSKALTKSIRNSGFLGSIAFGNLESSFQFVNYVFRCNDFAAGDGKFAIHRDTPYFDRTRSHVSKYTLIVYLTSGSASPALRVDDIPINDIQEMTCVVFDQRYQHEGQPFMDNTKVFLRTELIFEDTNLGENPEIASLFSEACYMTGQSVFHTELAKYAHECFERANSLHWAIEMEARETFIYLQKRFGSFEFITDGHDYWFPNRMGSVAVDFAILAVLDHFNCKISGKPFHSMCKSTVLKKHPLNSNEIWGWFTAEQSDNPGDGTMRRFDQADLNLLIRTSPKEPFVRRENPYIDSDGEDEEDEESGACCPFHCYSTFDAWADVDVFKTYEACCKFTRRKLFDAPLLILGQELVINPSNIKFHGDKIFIQRSSSKNPLPPINFAACWNSDTHFDFIDVDQEIPAPKLLLPPITFHEFDEGYHLVLDFFRNDWMVKVDDNRKIPIPVISNEIGEDTAYKSPFFRKLRRRSVDFEGLEELLEEAEDTMDYFEGNESSGAEEN